MMSNAAIHEALAALAKLKSMNAPRILKRPLMYVRTREEQERMDQIKRDIEQLERAK